MRKRSVSKALIDRADKALQDAYRRRYKGEPCEVCGSPFQVIHHHILKSKSNFLRFHKDNLIKLCHFCHSKIAFGDNQIIAKYSIRRGKRWLAKIDKLKGERRSAFGKGELERLISYYEQWKSTQKSKTSEIF